MPVQIKQLTDAAIKALKPGEKPYKKGDGNNLILCVATSGSKVWRVGYRDAQGKKQAVTLGAYPAISLKDARELRDAVQVRLAKGEPAKLATEQAPQPVENELSLSNAIEKWLEHMGDNCTQKYVGNIRFALAKNIEPALGKLKFSGITRELLVDELDKMSQAGKAEYVRKVRMWLDGLYNWALHHKMVKTNIPATIDPKYAFKKKPKVQHQPHLPQREVQAFWKLVHQQKTTNGQLVCRLEALTWMRANELVNTKWSEIDGDTIKISGDRMKEKLEHWVPLSRQAKEILVELKSRADGSEFILPGVYKRNQPLNKDTGLSFVYNLGFKGRMSQHGWRHIGSTWGNEQHTEDGHRRWDKDYVEMALAHVLGGVRGVYNAAEYLQPRRLLLQSFADWLDAGLTSTEGTPSAPDVEQRQPALQ
jgi:integrase